MSDKIQEQLESLQKSADDHEGRLRLEEDATKIHNATKNMINWSALRTLFITALAVQSVLGGMTAYYLDSRFDPVGDRIEALEEVVSNKASKGSLTALTSRLEEEVVRSKNIDNVKKLRIDDLEDLFTKFQISTNDALSSVDILCSLINTKTVEIRKLDAITQQQLQALYAAINVLRDANGLPQIQLPIPPNETGRSVDSCK